MKTYALESSLLQHLVNGLPDVTAFAVYCFGHVGVAEL
jgi:hypothetical protein